MGRLVAGWQKPVLLSMVGLLCVAGYHLFWASVLPYAHPLRSAAGVAHGCVATLLWVNTVWNCASRRPSRPRHPLASLYRSPARAQILVPPEPRGLTRADTHARRRAVRRGRPGRAAGAAGGRRVPRVRRRREAALARRLAPLRGVRRARAAPRPPLPVHRRLRRQQQLPLLLPLLRPLLGRHGVRVLPLLRAVPRLRAAPVHHPAARPVPHTAARPRRVRPHGRALAPAAAVR
eukprot:3822591-Prymnesium_polylepis.1